MHVGQFAQVELLIRQWQAAEATETEQSQTSNILHTLQKGALSAENTTLAAWMHSRFKMSSI